MMLSPHKTLRRTVERVIRNYVRTELIEHVQHDPRHLGLFYVLVGDGQNLIKRVQLQTFGQEAVRDSVVLNQIFELQDVAQVLRLEPAFENAMTSSEDRASAEVESSRLLHREGTDGRCFLIPLDHPSKVGRSRPSASSSRFSCRNGAS